ncbi:MAG: histidine kinase,Response regulator receiver domain proteinhistidine kinase [Rhodospirillales bacterium]|nr:histidine kinase,Response regulator receiver domain proteinhistidine kinase [Rhodospirillales bacterium]
MFRLLAASLALLLLLAVPQAAQAQRVTPTLSDPVELGSATWVLRDPDGTIDLDAAREAWRAGGFKAPASAVPRHHAGDGASWLRIELDLRNDPGRKERWLEFEAVRPRLVELYVFDAQDETVPLLVYRGGLEFRDTAPDRLYASAIGDVGATELVLYGRMVADFAPELRTRLVTERDAFARERRLERYLGPLEGGVVGLVVLLLALWVGARDRLLLWGAALVATCLVVVHLLLGQDRRLWPDVLQEPRVNQFLFLAAFGLFMGCALRFADRWLNTRSYAPRLSRVLRTVSLVVPLLIVLLPSLMPRAVLPFLTVLMAIAIATMFAAILRAVLARAQGTWLLIAFAVPMIGSAMLRLAAANGLLPWAEGMPYMSFIGMIALALGITIGLADASRRRLQAMVDLRTRQLERANADLHALSDGRNRLLGVVAHDVRAPLASMVTAAELLRAKQIDDSDAPALLDLVAANGRATLAMLEDLLDLSAIESGTIPVALRPTDLLAVTQERVRLLRPLLGTRTVHINGELCNAMADPLRLGQALDNLLSNAAKFSPAAAPIELIVHRNGKDAMLDVADRGAGMTDVEMQRLFAPFSPGTRRPLIGRSTGLGLAIVKRLVELQSGRVEAHPRADGGTIFRILLPVC